MAFSLIFSELDMISTRVMDIKLREAAEGLGEDSTGKAFLRSSCPGRTLVGLWGWERSFGFSAWRVGSVQCIQTSPDPSQGAGEPI